jgi:hypothetical protein
MQSGVYLEWQRWRGGIRSTGCFREVHKDEDLEKQATFFDLRLVLRLLRRLRCIRCLEYGTRLLEFPYFGHLWLDWSRRIIRMSR